MARKKKATGSSRLAAIAAAFRSPATVETNVVSEHPKQVEKNVCSGCQPAIEDLMKKILAQEERISALEKRVGHVEATKKKEELQLCQVDSLDIKVNATLANQQTIHPADRTIHLLPATSEGKIPAKKDLKPSESMTTDRSSTTFGFFECENSKKVDLFNKFAAEPEHVRTTSTGMDNLHKEGSLASIVSGSLRDPSLLQPKFASNTRNNRRFNPSFGRSYSNSQMDSIPERLDYNGSGRYSAGRNALNCSSPYVTYGSAVDLRQVRNSLAKVKNNKVDEDIFSCSIREEGLDNTAFESDC